MVIMVRPGPGATTDTDGNGNWIIILGKRGHKYWLHFDLLRTDGASLCACCDVTSAAVM